MNGNWIFFLCEIKSPQIFAQSTDSDENWTPTNELELNSRLICFAGNAAYGEPTHWNSIKMGLFYQTIRNESITSHGD